MTRVKPKLLYIWKGSYPWDIRVDKICNSLKKDFQVVILSRWNGEKQSKEIIDDLVVHRVGYEKSFKSTIPIPYNFIWQKAISEINKEYEFDIVIVREILLAKQTINVFKRKKVLLVLDMAENYPAAMKVWLKYKRNPFVHLFKVPEFLEKNVVKYFKLILTVCKEQNQRLIDTYNIPNKNILVIHNTPNYKVDYIDRNYNQKDKIIFGHHGVLSDDKQFYVFIEAFIEYQRMSNKSIELHLYGVGESLPRIKTLISSYHASDIVKLKGQYDYNELDHILRSFDIGVIPYKLNDFNNTTIHNKLFDYFAYSLPVFTSEIIPTKRVLEEFNAGLSINCEDKKVISNGIDLLMQSDLSLMSKNSYLAYKTTYNWESDSNNLLKSINNFYNATNSL